VRTATARYRPIVPVDDFRCTGCGAVAALETPRGTLTLGMKRRPIDTRAPTCACGARRWVLVGSFTEFYAYTGRDDVCRFGDHVAAHTETYRLVPGSPADPTTDGRLRIETLEVRVCPDHLPTLIAEGFLGFILVS